MKSNSVSDGDKAETKAQNLAISVHSLFFIFFSQIILGKKRRSKIQEQYTIQSVSS